MRVADQRTASPDVMRPAYESQLVNFVSFTETEVKDQPEETIVSSEFDLAGLMSIRSSGATNFSTPFELCLRPFLEELGWTGEERHLIEAMPHLEPVDDIETFRAVIGRLGFQTDTHTMALRHLVSDRLPAVVLLERDHPVVLLSVNKRGEGTIFDGQTCEFQELNLDRTVHVCCFAEPIDSQAEQARSGRSTWFSLALDSVRQPVGVIFALTFLANVLALATPIYVMNVYNSVIGTKALDTLVFFFASVALLLSFEIYVKRARGRLLAFVGARISSSLMNAGLSKILSLPISMIESASVGSQILRLKQFDGIHSFFTGPIATAFLDLPFVLLFFVAIAIISPSLAIVPVGLALTYVVLACIVLPTIRRGVNAYNSANTKNQEFLTDAISKRTSIRQLRAERHWRKRYVSISRDLSARRSRMQFFDGLLGSLAQSTMMLAGIATLMIGALLVISEELSIGALIAVMMFVWRVLAPLQTVFVSLNGIGQFIESIRQVNALMRIPPEYPVQARRSVLRKFEGRISLVGVGFRYGPQDEPVFRGLNLEIEPGQLVGISSATASGKSTILKLILGLYKPQAGAVLLDGLNLQQLDPHEVRAGIGYCPIEPVFFYGSIAQNLRLVCPTASDEEIEIALLDAGLDIASPLFPQGIETRLTNQTLSTMPVGCLQSLSLARVYCKQASINLLNDPAAQLDEVGDRALVRKLLSLKGKATTVLVTNRPHHLNLCDRVITLHNGVVAGDRAPSAGPSEGPQGSDT